jgi:hypothetical protein
LLELLVKVTRFKVMVPRLYTAPPPETAELASNLALLAVRVPRFKIAPPPTQLALGTRFRRKPVLEIVSFPSFRSPPPPKCSPSVRLSATVPPTSDKVPVSRFQIPPAP